MSKLSGLWIDDDYLFNSRLTGNEMKVIAYIKYRAEHGVFRGGNVEISIDLKMHKVRVSEAISSLLTKCFLERFETKFYKVCHAWKVTENVTPKVEKVTENVTPKVEKVTENVTFEPIVKVTENVTKSYGKRNSEVTENVTLSYIEKHSLKHNNNNGAKGVEIEIIDSKNEKSFKEKKVKASKLAEVTFLESELADFDVFEEFLKCNHPDLDTNYYYHKISTWLDKETGLPPKRKVWKSTVKIFLENDYKRAELVTNSKQKPDAKSNPSPQQTNLSTDKAVELDNLVDRYFAIR